MRRRDAEQHEEEGEHPAEVELGPVAIGGEERVSGDGDLAAEGGGVAGARDRLAEALSHADGPAERYPEHAEAIGHADAEMDGERRRRHEPAVVVQRRNDALLVQ